MYLRSLIVVVGTCCNFVKVIASGFDAERTFVVVVVDIWRRPRIKIWTHKKHHVIDQNISCYNNTGGSCAYILGIVVITTLTHPWQANRKKIIMAVAQKPIDACETLPKNNIYNNNNNRYVHACEFDK